MRTPKRILIVAGWNVLILLVLIAVIDVGARLFIRGRSYPLFDDSELTRSDRPFITEHQTRGFALRPGFSTPSIRINGDGFRGPELPASFQGMYRILAVGESTTFGWKVGDGETYPQQLQDYLRGAGVDSVWVINAGVPSYTSLQTLLYVRELLPRIKPHLVIVNEMWNDIYCSSRDVWFPEMLVMRRPSAWRRFLLRHSGLYLALTLRGGRGGGDAFNEDALEFYRTNLAAVIEECRAHGAEPMFVHPPFDASVIRTDGAPVVGGTYYTSRFLLTSMERYVRTAGNLAAERGVPFIDHRLSGSRADGPARPALFIDPIHPTAAGNRLIAEDVGRYLIGHNVF
jgi:lysophospholipase L1-like esterase